MTRLVHGQAAIGMMLGGVLLVGGHLAYSIRSLLGAFRSSAAVTLDAASTSVSVWHASRVAQMSLLARLAAAQQAPTDEDSLLRAFVDHGMFERAALVDTAGRVLASSEANGGSRRLAWPASSRDESPLSSDSVFRSIAPSGDSATITFASWIAPGRRGGQRGRRLVVSAVIAARVLPNFSLQNEADRAVRTTLLERRGDSAIVLVATARSLDGHGSVLASRDVPEFVRAATPGHATFGVGVGLSGTRTIHAAVSPPLLPWVIVREHDVADVERMLSLPLAINEIVLVLFYALAVLAVRHRLRAGRQRRDAELVRVRSDFVSSISHELRTPLTQIRMYAEMLNTGLLPHPAESNRALQVIEKESARLSVLVDKVLNLTRVRQASAGSEPPATDLADVIGRVAASVNVLAADRGTTLVVRVPTRMLARIDAEALHQVLLNLLDNALKYGPRGQTVHLSAQPVGGVVRLLVEDEGPGVPAAEREMIWDRFRRGSLAERGQEIGSGIGLAIVRELVVQSGGRVFVEDRTPKPGARFVVELPGTND